MEASATDGKPPYGGFRTFWNFVEQLAEQGPLPQLLDRSVMGSRGGSARSELYTGLRFFRLMGDDKAPTPELRSLTADPGPTTEKLRSLVEQHYKPIIDLNLQTATPRQVDEALANLGATPSTIGRSRTFFLNAAEEAGIEVGRLLKAARGTAPTTRPRTRSTTRPRRTTVKGSTGSGNNENATNLPPLVAALVDELPPMGTEWETADAREWLSLIVRAIARGYKLDRNQLKEP